MDAVDSFAMSVNMNSFSLNANALHFSVAGQLALGTAFATQMKSLVAVPEPYTLGLLGLFGIAAAAIRFRRGR